MRYSLFTFLFAAATINAADDPLEVKTKDLRADVVYEAKDDKFWAWGGPVPLRSGQSGPSANLLSDKAFVGFILLAENFAQQIAEPKSEAGIAISVAVMSFSDKKKHTYTPWKDAVLKDELGNTYAQVRLNSNLIKRLKVVEEVTRIDSGAEAADILLFEKPVAKATKFTLSLRGKNVDSPSDLVIRFTRKDLEAAAELDKKNAELDKKK